jgi:hypothetical protein
MIHTYKSRPSQISLSLKIFLRPGCFVPCLCGPGVELVQRPLPFRPTSVGATYNQTELPAIRLYFLLSPVTNFGLLFCGPSVDELMSRNAGNVGHVIPCHSHNPGPYWSVGYSPYSSTTNVNEQMETPIMPVRSLHLMSCVRPDSYIKKKKMETPIQVT